MQGFRLDFEWQGYLLNDRCVMDDKNTKTGLMILILSKNEFCISGKILSGFIYPECGDGGDVLTK